MSRDLGLLFKSQSSARLAIESVRYITRLRGRDSREGERWEEVGEDIEEEGN